MIRFEVQLYEVFVVLLREGFDDVGFPTCLSPLITRAFSLLKRLGFASNR